MSKVERAFWLVLVFPSDVLFGIATWVLTTVPYWIGGKILEAKRGYK